MAKTKTKTKTKAKPVVKRHYIINGKKAKPVAQRQYIINGRGEILQQVKLNEWEIRLLDWGVMICSPLYLGFRTVDVLDGTTIVGPLGVLVSSDTKKISFIARLDGWKTDPSRLISGYMPTAKQYDNMDTMEDWLESLYPVLCLLETESEWIGTDKESLWKKFRGK